MSKARNIILALFVFFLTLLCVVLPFMQSETQTLGWVIALVVAAGVGVGSYFFLVWVQKRAAVQQDKIARNLLAPALPPGEEILLFVQGYTGPGRTGMTFAFGALGDALINTPRRKFYYLGLTRQSLVLVQVKGVKPTGVSQVLRRGEVTSLEFDSGAFKEPKLVLQIAGERMELRLDYNWIKHAKEVNAAWNNLA